MSLSDWEREQDRRKKIAAGWHVSKKGYLVPPPSKRIIQKGRFDPSKTSEADFYAEALLDEIKSTHNSVIECFRDLEKQLTVIKEQLMAIRRRLKKT